VHKPILSLLFVMLMLNATAQDIYSPDKKIAVTFKVKSGKPVYQVSYNDNVVINESALGIEQSNANLYENLTLKSASPITLVKDNYTMVNAKKHNISYAANKKEYTLVNADRKIMQVIFQVSNDGVAFRYYFPEKATTITKEVSSYNFTQGTAAWLQPKALAQSGWSNTNPSYEEEYRENIPVGTANKNGWVYPALFKTNDTWILITEAGMDGTYCGTKLSNDSASTVFHIGFPDPREVYTGQGYLPKDVTYTPWRIITIGSLKTITESTIGTDLAIPAKFKDDSYIHPGKASWSWIMSKDDSITYTEQIRYIDLAAKMKWQYCLIDAGWDVKIGYDKVKALVDYARLKNVNILVWYNSSGKWNVSPQTPKGALLTHEQRDKEFARLQQMGVKGIKVDFFAGDGQSMIQYYIDILNDAAKYKLLVNFHGATLPRGWARTYPQLVSTEAIKGYEMITFGQDAANKEPAHVAMLPFTRNAFDPMDFTPMNLYRIQGRITRRTTSAFELATSVLFLSGIQHYAESPAGMSHQPDYIIDFLQNLPNSWDDVKFIDGFPGKYVVIARKSGDKWYIAGVNADATEMKLNIDLSGFNKNTGVLITDGEQPLSFNKSAITLPAGKKLDVSMKARGGFVIVL